MNTNIYENNSQDNINGEELQLISQINEWRLNNGLQELQISKTLSLVAGRKALDRYDNVRDFGPNDGSASAHGWSDQRFHANEPWTHNAVYDGARKFGIDYTVEAEVVTANLNVHDDGITDLIQAESAFGNWKLSPSHNASLLNADFTQIGVGIVGGVAYATFGTQPDPLGPATVELRDHVNYHIGTAHEDHIQIHGGTDGSVILAEGGNDQISIDVWSTNYVRVDGGDGFDVLTLNANRADFQNSGGFGHAGNGFNDYDLVHGDKQYSLSNVELVKFNDGHLALGVNTDQAFLYRLYDAAFDRVPDEGGFNYWSNRMMQGDIGRYDLAAHFIKVDEYTSRYGDNQAPDRFVDALYHNIFGRDPDQGGRDYWTGRLHDGTSQREVFNSFVDSDEHKALTSHDLGNGLWFW